MAHPATQRFRRRGLMFVLSSPSGAGKTTISRRLLRGDAKLTLSVSATTRPKRPGEVDGQDYFFMDKAQFEQMVDCGEFLEHAKVFGHYYGTPKKPVMDALENSHDVLFDIDWQGTQQLSQNARDDLVSIFILPPSAHELEQRLRTRAQDPEDVIKDRMAKASSEISHWAEYDYVLINRDLDECVDRARGILAAERLKRHRLAGIIDFVKELQDSL